MVQVVVYLQQAESTLVTQTTFEIDTLRHEFQVIRLWEQLTEDFFRYPGLLPYAALSQTSDRAAVLQRVAQAIDTVADRRQQSNLAAATGILAGLVLEKRTIQRLVRRELMQESVMYQELPEEARAEARQAVRQEIQLEIERSLILRLLDRRVGTLPDAARSQVEALSLTQLELLGEASLNFSSLPDLETWLAAHSEASGGN